MMTTAGKEALLPEAARASLRRDYVTFFEIFCLFAAYDFPHPPPSSQIVRGLVPQESPSPPRSGHSCPDSR